MEAPALTGERARGSRLRHLFIGGTEGNERLTTTAAAVLLVLLAVEGATLLSIRSLLSLSVHVFIGMLLIPPVLLKLASTGSRVACYYAGRREYRQKGPPALLMRLLVAPVVVASTAGLFASGVALIVVGPGRGFLLGLHKPASWSGSSRCPHTCLATSSASRGSFVRTSSRVRPCGEPGFATASWSARS
jgi:hypothetical protein